MLFFRYQGKNKGLIHDVTKIIATLKGKRGDHRIFRLAENLCMNLILSMREFFSVKRDGKVAENINLFFFYRLPWQTQVRLTFVLSMLSHRVQPSLRKL